MFASMLGGKKEKETIMYTYTDEAPMLATHAFYPTIQAFCKHASIDMELKDISVAARVLANFNDFLTEEQKEPDTLGDLGKLRTSPSFSSLNSSTTS